MNCKKQKKKLPVSKNCCFQCIRNTEYSDKYEFVYECATDVMLKMDNEELNDLARDVLKAVRETYTDRTPVEELYLLGDCFARVFLHLIPRGNFLGGAYQKLYTVRETVRVAAEVSISAWGVCEMYEPGEWRKPRCWLDMHV